MTPRVATEDGPVHELTLQDARRLAVRAQLLEADRPDDVVETVTGLSLLQLDPTAAIAPSADLVLWSRIGESYRPEQLVHELEVTGRLTELVAFVRPTAELPAYLVLDPLYASRREWLEDNESFADDVLARLRADGPLLSRDIPDTAVRPWASSGWNNDKNVTRMLEILVLLGQVAIVGRRGKQRVFDLAERVYPPEVRPLPDEQAAGRRDELRLRAMGIARQTATAVPGEPVAVGGAGEPAVVEGVPGRWRVDPEQLTDLRERDFRPRTALLSPFDRLVHDRKRLAELFGYEYVLEMYKPAAARRWGYYALPVLHGDALVGKLDAKVDRKAGVLEVFAVHEDVTFDAAVRAGVDAEIASLARWLGVAVSR